MQVTEQTTLSDLALVRERNKILSIKIYYDSTGPLSEPGTVVASVTFLEGKAWLVYEGRGATEAEAIAASIQKNEEGKNS